MRPAVIVPAFNAASTVAAVVVGVRDAWGTKGPLPIIVVDDGSTDATSSAVDPLDVVLVRHPTNCGKGAALRTGLSVAFELGCDVALSIDADGQHPSDDAVRLLTADVDPDALVLGVRDLRALGAPLPNILGNRLANFSLAVLTLLRFHDTQCGLRRYPVRTVLALRARDNRFGFESEVLLRAARAGVPFVEIPVRCVYARGCRQTTHYRRILDTLSIIVRMHVAYLMPWLRAPAPKARMRIPRRRVTWTMRLRQLGALWVGGVVFVVVLALLRWAIE